MNGHLRCAAASAALWFAAGGANAAGPIDELRAGVSLQSTGPISSNLESGAAIAAEVRFTGPLWLKAVGAPKPMIGGSLATADNATSFIYAGLNWRLSVPTTPFFVDAGLAGAVHDGRTSFDPLIDLPRQGSAFLGCRGLFRLSGGPGLKLGDRVTVSVQWEHLSNAGLCDPNEGLDNLGLRVGVRF